MAAALSDALFVFVRRRTPCRSLTACSAARPGPKLDLAAVQAQLAAAVRAGGRPDADLTRAPPRRPLRDAGLTPVLPEEFDARGRRVRRRSRRRLASLVALLELEPVRAAVAQHAAPASAGQLVSTAVHRPGPRDAAPDARGAGAERAARRGAGPPVRRGAPARASRAKPRRSRRSGCTSSTTAGCSKRPRRRRPPAADRAERLRQLQEQQERAARGAGSGDPCAKHRPVPRRRRTIPGRRPVRLPLEHRGDAAPARTRRTVPGAVPRHRPGGAGPVPPRKAAAARRTAVADRLHADARTTSSRTPTSRAPGGW